MIRETDIPAEDNLAHLSDRGIERESANRENLTCLNDGEADQKQLEFSAIQSLDQLAIATALSAPPDSAVILHVPSPYCRALFVCPKHQVKGDDYGNQGE
jgi:hypothetical protein